MVDQTPSPAPSTPQWRLWVIAGGFLAAAIRALVLLGTEVLRPTGSPTMAGVIAYPVFVLGFGVIAYQILRGHPQGRDAARKFAKGMKVLAPAVTVGLYGIGAFVEGAVFAGFGLGLGIDPYSTAGGALSTTAVLGIVGIAIWIERVFDRAEVCRFFRS